MDKKYFQIFICGDDFFVYCVSAYVAQGTVRPCQEEKHKSDASSLLPSGTDGITGGRTHGT